MHDRTIAAVLWVVVAFLAVCVVFAGLATLGRSGQPSQSAAPPAVAAQPAAAPTTGPASVGRVGERREAGAAVLTVLRVDRAKELSTIDKAGAGKTFLLVEVLLETADRDKTPYNPLYFKVKDGDGFEYNSTLTAVGNGLKSGDLARGDKARGIVAFEIPEAAAGLVLSYEPLVLLGGYEPIRIALD